MAENDVIKLKNEIKNCTLIGEYVGSQNHQHLVLYSRVTILFYAVVDNKSEDNCWPCARSWSLFKRYGLDVVHI